MKYSKNCRSCRNKKTEHKCEMCRKFTCEKCLSKKLCGRCNKRVDSLPQPAVA